MPQETTTLREQLLRTGNGRFFYARIHEDGERRHFITLVQANTFKGRDHHYGGIVFNAVELQAVCERLRAYAQGFDDRTLGRTFPGKADRDAWLSTPGGSRTFFHVAERENVELFLIISRRPQSTGTVKEAGIFRREVEQLTGFLEEHAAALTTLSLGNFPAGFPTSAGVIEVLSFEPAGKENEEEEYSEEEQELLDSCEGCLGLIELAEKRIRLARRLDQLETATDDPELAHLEIIAAKLESEAQDPKLRSPVVVYTERENMIRRSEIRRDDIPASIEEEIDAIRERIEEIDGILAQEQEKVRLSRSQRDDPDGDDSEEEDSRE